jgi:putative ABC transport system ATP-binding protein
MRPLYATRYPARVSAHEPPTPSADARAGAGARADRDAPPAAAPTATPAPISTTALVFRRATGFVLRVPALTVEAGASLVVRGPSGSGKSTLLGLLSGELVASEGGGTGEVRRGGVELGAAGDATRRAIRARQTGQVFQTFELVASLDAFENVLLPFRLHGDLRLDAAARDRARTLLARVGLGGKERRAIDQLSHGERQRVAIARALVTEPDLVLADEPTGNLDPTLKREIAALLLEQSRAARAALVIATHDESIMPLFGASLDLGGAVVAGRATGGEASGTTSGEANGATGGGA